MSEQTLPPPTQRKVRLRPLDAATLVIFDRSRKVPRMLMGRRHQNQRFMPGVFVFPGGRVEKADRTVSVAGCLDRLVEERLMARVVRPSTSRARALALAAIRETFEETGLMVGTRDHGAPETAEGPWQAFAQHGVLPSLDGVSFIGRAITPPDRVKRFDTRFFAVDRREIAHEEPGAIGPDAEFTELAWVSIAESRKLELAPITRMMIDEIDRRLQGGFLPLLPVPFYRGGANGLKREEI